MSPCSEFRERIGQKAIVTANEKIEKHDIMVIGRENEIDNQNSSSIPAFLHSLFSHNLGKGMNHSLLPPHKAMSKIVEQIGLFSLDRPLA